MIMYNKKLFSAHYQHYNLLEKGYNNYDQRRINFKTLEILFNA